MKSCLKILFSVFFLLTLSLNSNEPTALIVPSTEEQLKGGCAEYTVNFENFPLNKKIDVFFHRVLQSKRHAFHKAEELVLTDDGLKTINGQKCLHYALTSAGFVPGERVTYHYRLNKNQIVEASYIPCPIHIESKNGTFSIEAELANIVPTTVYNISFTGLETDETIHVKTLSDTVLREHDKKFKSGEIFHFFPETAHEKGGLSTLEIVRNSGDKVLVELNWGINILEERTASLAQKS